MMMTEIILSDTHQAVQSESDFGVLLNLASNVKKSQKHRDLLTPCANHSLDAIS